MNVNTCCFDVATQLEMVTLLHSKIVSEKEGEGILGVRMKREEK
jgi:hypothetical protein